MALSPFAGTRAPARSAAPALASLALAGCGTPARVDPFNLGAHHYAVTASSPAVQSAFDRGLTLAYGFSHRAAEDEFRRAIAIDSTCAMAWWGVALVNGPHINFPIVPPDKARTAWEALTRARALESSASGKERALIEALAKRYADPQPQDRRPLDEAYAGAMREVAKRYPDDADIATLFAESMMDLRPWDLWTADGKPQPGTEEIKTTLERALKLAPAHPGANHYYIHVVEASLHPEEGLAAADRLGGLVPGASHLVHMPAHIYARVGRWADAEEANRRAIRADSVYRVAHPRPGFYAMYMAHNDHFLAYAAITRGRSAEAIAHARRMVKSVPPDFLAEYAPIADGYMIFVSEALMRFGRWEEILAEPAPGDSLPLSKALWHFTRAVALTALDRPAEAAKERQTFRAAAAALPKGYTFGNNSAADILSVASHLLDGEMAARRERFPEAIASLEAAVKVEDGLRYDEPPDWMQPARHTLGAVLLRAGRYAEAQAVYLEDLHRYPGNGWGFYGLGRALRLQKKDVEARRIEERFEKAWERADVKLGSTCFCQPHV
jgi:tetratricopeptide (TPR) repeat protein